MLTLLVLVSASVAPVPVPEHWSCRGEFCADVLAGDDNACEFVRGDGECFKQRKAVILTGYFVLEESQRFAVFSNSGSCLRNMARWKKSRDVRGPACTPMTPDQFWNHWIVDALKKR